MAKKTDEAPAVPMTHAERAERRTLIAAYAATHGIAEAAKKFNVSAGTVRTALIESGTDMADLLNNSRREFRRQVAEYAVEHGRVEAVQKFNTSWTAVDRGLQEIGVELCEKGANNLSVSSFKILRRLLDGVKSAEVQEEFHISRQRVSQIRLKAKEAGFDV